MIAALATPLDALPSLTLEQVNAQAELQTRVDRKYVLRRDAASEILSALPPGTHVVDIDGSRTARYSSVYFDTPERASFHLAATGRRRRFKIRTRCYVDTQTVFFEAKTRGGRGVTVKERILYAPDKNGTITAEGRDFALDALLAIGHPEPEETVSALRPMLTTTYERATFCQPGTASRVTVDASLRWEDVDGTTLELPDSVIVETKSGLAPSAMDRLLWARGCRPESISKFGTGTAALHPELRRNKWARVLRRHFDGVVPQTMSQNLPTC